MHKLVGTKEFNGFLIYLLNHNVEIYNLFGPHLSHSKGNLWIDMNPDKYTEQQSDILHQLLEDYKNSKTT